MSENDTTNAIQLLVLESENEGPATFRTCLQGLSGVAVAAQASNPAAALKAVNHHQIDVMLLDLAVCNIDVTDLIKQVRLTRSTVRMVVATAGGAPEDIFAAMDVGGDAYVLKDNLSTRLEPAIRNARVGAVWLDPGIAEQILRVIEAAPEHQTRLLPTGLVTMPLMPDEKSLLHQVAGSSCTDGVCMVDPTFIKKLKRFSASAAS